jgi:hypothetical protein
VGEVWASFPSFMNPAMKMQESLAENVEKAFESHDTMKPTSFLQSFIGIGSSPFGAVLGQDLISLLEITT